MSGGSYEYAYERIADAAQEVERRSPDNPLRLAFAKHLRLVAKAMHDIARRQRGAEWSGQGVRMTTIDVEVTECADCPAYSQDRRGFYRCHFVPRRDLPDDDLPVPQWCPLLQTSVTLRLKGGE